MDAAVEKLIAALEAVMREDRLAFSKETLARVTDLSVDSISKEIKHHNLPAKKYGVKPLVLREDAIAWLRNLPSAGEERAS